LILESEEWNQHFVNAAGNLNMAVALKMCKWILLPLLWHRQWFPCPWHCSKWPITPYHQPTR